MIYSFRKHTNIKGSVNSHLLFFLLLHFVCPFLMSLVGPVLNIWSRLYKAKHFNLAYTQLRVDRKKIRMLEGDVQIPQISCFYVYEMARI